MQNIAGSNSQSGDRNNSYVSVMSDLMSLVDHIQTSMQTLDLAIARELSPVGEEVYDNVIVLDDVTPCYVKANAALHACRAALAAAMHCLLDSDAAGYQAGRLAGNGRSAGLADCA